MGVNLKLPLSWASNALATRALAAMILMVAAVPMEAIANGAPDPEDRPPTPWLTLNQEGDKIAIGFEIARGSMFDAGTETRL